MKKVLLITLLFVINGCVYRTEICSISEVVEGMCGIKGTEFPKIAYYQKPDTIGKTDVKQRWRDAVSCGAEYGDANLKIEKQIYLYKISKFEACMINKGYKRFQRTDCGYQEPKWNKGKCNL